MNPEKVIALDIETGPQPIEQLRRSIEIGKPPGNYKNPEAIEKWKQAEFDKQVDRAALHPETGELLAYGYQVHDEAPILFYQSELVDEAKLLESLWCTYTHYTAKGYSFAGSNFKGFDIPFCYVRSLGLGVDIPNPIKWESYGNKAGCYDLAEWWSPFYRENKTRASLDKMAKFLGHKGKNGDGALFYKQFDENQYEALEYLKNDIDMTRLCIDKLCPPNEPTIKDSPELEAAL